MMIRVMAVHDGQTIAKQIRILIDHPPFRCMNKNGG